MKKLLIFVIIIALIIIGFSSLYISNKTEMKNEYMRKYEQCIKFSKGNQIETITKDNINLNITWFIRLKAEFEKEINSCIEEDGCFHTCGKSCNPDYLEANFIDIINYRNHNKVCTLSCEPKCLYDILK